MNSTRPSSQKPRRPATAIGGRAVIALLGVEIRPRMVAALETCKQHFKVACLTNNMKTDDESRQNSPFDTTAVAEVYALFDAVIESRHLGIRKPNPEFYELACKRMGVAPEETVFLDDLGSNLKPARALGMITIKVVTEEQTLADLEKALGISMA